MPKTATTLTLEITHWDPDTSGATVKRMKIYKLPDPEATFPLRIFEGFRWVRLRINQVDALDGPLMGKENTVYLPCDTPDAPPGITIPAYWKSACITLIRLKGKTMVALHAHHVESHLLLEEYQTNAWPCRLAHYHTYRLQP